MIKTDRAARKRAQRLHFQWLLSGSLILLCSWSVLAQANLVVPGKSVGSVRLGDLRDAVFMTLGKPSETKRWRSGLVKDSWLGPEPAQNSADSQIFFKVIYRRGRVVQIEFNDPKYKTAAGVSVASTLAEFRAQHKRPRARAFVYDDREGSGFVGYYYDDVAGGIAFSFGTQDYFDATTIPEALRVHASGQPVIPDAGGRPTKATDERPVGKQQHASKAQPQRQDTAEVEKVIRTFWQDLGRLYGEGLKGLLAWPMMIVEAAESGNKQNILRNPQEFDEAFKRTPEAQLKRGKSEFFGTKLSRFSVQMLNANLASVSYECELPKDIVETNEDARRGRFRALTVLQREPDRDGKWKIVLITVPK